MSPKAMETSLSLDIEAAGAGATRTPGANPGPRGTTVKFRDIAIREACMFLATERYLQMAVQKVAQSSQLMPDGWFSSYLPVPAE